MKLTPKKLKFVVCASELFGHNATINKQQVRDAAHLAFMPVPTWFLNRCKVGYNMFKLPSLDDKPTPAPTPAPAPITEEAAEQARQQKAARDSAEAAARGELPDASKLPDAIKIEEGVAQQTTTMDPVTKARTDLQAKDQPKETVATSQAAQADKTIGQDLQGRGYTADTVSDVDVEVKNAEGEVTQGPIKDIQGTITGGVTSATVDEIKIEAGIGDSEGLNKLLEGDYLVKTPDGEDPTVTATPDAERSERNTILGTEADDGTAAEIINTVGYTAAKQRAVKGKLAQREAAEMLKVVGNLPPDIAASIVEDPAVMIAQVDENPVAVNAAIAALPTEA